MKIAYLTVTEDRLRELISEDGIQTLKENFGINPKDFDYVVVYIDKDGKIEYNSALSTRKGKGVRLIPQKRVKRAVDAIHKFWARKPWWAVTQYIMTFSKEGDVVCDPMCGSAIAGYEALRLRRRAIMVDLNPFAIFMARNSIKPGDISSLLSAFKEVLNRKIDLVEINKKDATINEVISSFYLTICRKCKKETQALVYVWDTVYEFTGRTPEQTKAKILLMSISDVMGLEGLPNKISQHWLNVHWEDVAKKSKDLCEIKYSEAKKFFEGPLRPTLVTKIFGRIVQGGFYRRSERYPILVYYQCHDKSCPHHNGAIEPLEDYDKNLLEKIEKIERKYPHPIVPLRYSDGKIFDTARPDALFVSRERLSTWSGQELKNQFEQVHHLFTNRNLLALSILFWSIEQVSDKEVREQLLLAFTETLYKVSKLNSYEIRPTGKGFRFRRATMWREPRYSIPPDFSEENVLYRFDRSFTKICEAKEQANYEIGDYYKEAKDADDFVTDSKTTIIFLTYDARDLSKKFARYKDVVNMVFTDPPYGDAIQYFELCTFWTSWLLMDDHWKKTYGDGDWWKKEIVKNDVQGKTLEDFERDLIRVFKSLDEITKPNAVWVITYHKREPKYWTALTEALLLCGRGFYDEEKHELLGRSFNPSKDFRFLETDAYTIWKKLPVEKIKSMEKAAEEFFRIIDGYISQYYGVIPRACVEKAYVEMSWSIEKDIYEKFFDGKFDTFLEKHTIQIPTANGVLVVIRRDTPAADISPTKWIQLWDDSYGKIPAELLLRSGLQSYVKGKLERGENISLDIIYEDVVRRIDGRITQSTVLKVLEEVAEYDWLRGTYTPKKEIPKIEGTLYTWMETERKEVSLPKPPELLIPEIALKLIERGQNVYLSDEYEPPTISSFYAKKIVKRVEADFRKFPLMTEKNGKRFCLDVNAFANASQVLLKRDVSVIVLCGNDEIIKRSKYFQRYIDERRLFLIDVRGLKTDEVINKTLSYMEEW